MNDKERLEKIKRTWNENNTVSHSYDYEWLIEQAEKMIKVREIYENGGEAWQDDVEDVIFDRGETNESRT